VAESIEAQALDILAAAFALIVAGPTYLTSPVVREWTPQDPIDQRGHLFVLHSRTAKHDELSSVNRYGWRMTFTAVLVANDQRTIVNMRRDAIVALATTEAAAVTAFGDKFYPGDYAARIDLQNAGQYIGTLDLSLDLSADRTTA